MIKTHTRFSLRRLHLRNLFLVDYRDENHAEPIWKLRCLLLFIGLYCNADGSLYSIRIELKTSNRFRIFRRIPHWLHLTLTPNNDTDPLHAILADHEGYYSANLYGGDGHQIDELDGNKSLDELRTQLEADHPRAPITYTIFDGKPQREWIDPLDDDPFAHDPETIDEWIAETERHIQQIHFDNQANDPDNYDPPLIWSTMTKAFFRSIQAENDQDFAEPTSLIYDFSDYPIWLKRQMMEQDIEQMLADGTLKQPAVPF